MRRGGLKTSAPNDRASPMTAPARTMGCNVLFLCTGNSARSILAEAILNASGDHRYHGFSAGSQPAGRVNPLTLEVLAAQGLPTDGLHSKGWEVFAAPGAPPMDLVITVCDRAAGESCPVWPGHPVALHWGFPDPAAVTGTAATRRAAFDAAYGEISAQLAKLTAIPADRATGPDCNRHFGAITPPGG